MKLRPYFVFESSIPGYERIGENKFKMTSKSCPTGHLIIYFHVQLEVSCNEIILNPSIDEVEASVWIERDKMFEILNRNHDVDDLEVSGFGRAMEARNFKLKEFFPYYPNSLNTGIGKAATFALKYLIMLEARDSAAQESPQKLSNAKL